MTFFYNYDNWTLATSNDKNLFVFHPGSVNKGFRNDFSMNLNYSTFNYGKQLAQDSMIRMGVFNASFY